MRLRLSDEARADLDQIERSDFKLREALEACIERLRVDPDEFESGRPGGLSKKRVQELWRKRVRVYRYRFDDVIPNHRILYLLARDLVFVTGIHSRDQLSDYTLVRKPIVRASLYWGKSQRGTLEKGMTK
jgi:hypothetical protein